MRHPWPGKEDKSAQVQTQGPGKVAICPVRTTAA
jgi:hypothetical protein